ncbi:MAG TPA: aspartate aminotransferase family protein [Dehalococcoidia bacterium]|nr:aspartate aminotransferase family protein [Dehalococcoidia bacterium]
MTSTQTQRTQADYLRLAHELLPGGAVSTEALPDGTAFVVERAQGAHLWDVDGREYIDYVIGSGPMLLGHAHPEVVAAVQAQVARGTTYFTLNRQVLELAELLVSAIPCAEQVRFVGSGTEATFHALRIARAATGREKILKFEGGYHGNHDYGMMGGTPAEPPPWPAALPDSAGIPRAVQETVLIAPFNDAETATGIIADHGGELAAVIVEPFQRAIPPAPGFLAALRETCRRHGIVLIFDEVVTGFRFAWGGAQERYGVVPDLATYGKVIAGGYAGGAIAGRRDLLGFADPARRSAGAAMTGTLSGNPVSAAAGLATLRVLERERATIYPRLYAYGERLAQGMTAAFGRRGIAVQAPGEGPIFQIFAQATPIRDYRDTLEANGAVWSAFCRAMTRRGVFLNGGKVYCSAAHGDDDLAATLVATEHALDEVAS